MFRRDVGQQFALTAGIGDRHHRTIAAQALAAGQQLQTGDQLVGIIDAYRTVTFEDGVIDGGVSGNGTGMADGKTLCRLAAPDLVDHDRHIGLRGTLENGDEFLRAAHGLDEKANGACGFEAQREIHVIGDIGGDLLARRDREIEAETPVILVHRRPDRARLAR